MPANVVRLVESTWTEMMDAGNRRVWAAGR
jgi:hypothetical protein